MDPANALAIERVPIGSLNLGIRGRSVRGDRRRDIHPTTADRSQSRSLSQ